MSKAFSKSNDTEADAIVGIDLGLNFIATTYNSQGTTQFFQGRAIKHKRGHFKALRKQLQQCQTPSARKRLKQIGSRENRYVHDVNHQVTKALVEQYPKGTLFVLEDLSGVRKATEKVRIRHRYVSVSWAFYQFREMLEYKAELYGHSRRRQARDFSHEWLTKQLRSVLVQAIKEIGEFVKFLYWHKFWKICL